jgi:hypothetical protein
MENVIVTSQVVSKLDETRNALVGGLKKTGELINNYANVLCGAFNVMSLDGSEVVTAWYELRGKAKAGIKSERAKFVEAMTNAGYEKGTIDVNWQRVKEASGYVTAGNRVSGKTDVDSKTVAELQTIINRIFKAEETGEECKASEFKGELMDIFASLGGNVDKLG